MKSCLCAALFLFLATTAEAATLPGFRVETLAEAEGFVSSLALDSKGIVYFTTTDGWIYRVDGGQSVRVASLPTRAGGNGGLLGMALINDATAVVHYTIWAGEDKVVDDVISKVDLATGAETVLHMFACDVEFHDNGASSEHHGGNPTVAPDGSIFVGIGEYNGHVIAQRPEWNGGKVFRLHGGEVTQYALGLRNPFDLAWDPELNRLVVADNGPRGGDEIHIIQPGANCGWPDTYGNGQHVDGTVVPDYVFENTVAPTGLARLKGDGLLDRGYLLAAFVTQSIYYFPDLTATPIPDPIPIVEDFGEFVIDVTQGPDGAIYFATASYPGLSAIHRLRPPAPGDCNGDGLTDFRDILPLMLELGDGSPQPMLTAQNGAHKGSWGCDVTGDRVIDAADLHKLAQLVSGRRRSVR